MLGNKEETYVIREVHGGFYGQHIGGNALENKCLRVGYM